MMSGGTRQARTPTAPTACRHGSPHRENWADLQVGTAARSAAGGSSVLALTGSPPREGAIPASQVRPAARLRRAVPAWRPAFPCLSDIKAGGVPAERRTTLHRSLRRRYEKSRLGLFRERARQFCRRGRAGRLRNGAPTQRSVDLADLDRTYGPVPEPPDGTKSFQARARRVFSSCATRAVTTWRASEGSVISGTPRSTARRRTR